MVWGSSKKKAPAARGIPGDLDQDQVDALGQMRMKVIGVSDMTIDPGEVGLDFDAVPPDKVLLRFLRARKFDVDLAFQMFQECRQWRIDYGAGQLLNTFPGFLGTEQHQACWSCYQFGYHHTDKLGRPIYIDRVGHADLKALKANISSADFLRWHVYGWEECMEEMFPAASQEFGHVVETNFTILDLAGISVSDIWDSEVQELLKAIAGTDKANYPEMLGKMFIVNAPMLFHGAWAVIKNFLDPSTQAKIEVVGSNQETIRTKLLEYVDEDKLPTFLGGTCSCEGGCIEASPGPWTAYPKSEKRQPNYEPPKRAESVPLSRHRRAASDASMMSVADSEHDIFYTPPTTPRGLSKAPAKTPEEVEAEKCQQSCCYRWFGCCAPTLSNSSDPPEMHPQPQRQPQIHHPGIEQMASELHGDVVIEDGPAHAREAENGSILKNSTCTTGRSSRDAMGHVVDKMHSSFSSTSSSAEEGMDEHFRHVAHQQLD